MQSYTDVKDRFKELLNPLDTVWPVGSLSWDHIENLCHIDYVPDVLHATWMLAQIACPKFMERLAEFAHAPGTARFILVGTEDITDILPDRMHVTSVEEYPHGMFLIVGRKV